MALLNTDFLTARTQTFRATRHIFEGFVQEGVVGSGDYKVTPTGTSLQWSVAAGQAFVRGEDTTRQGLYPQINDAAVTGLVAAGHATNPRIDQVILRIFDSSVTGGSDTPTLSTLAGTATGGATLDNRTGAASLPNGAIRLADILVPAGHSGVLVANTHIRDRRPWARGAYWIGERSSASVNVPLSLTVIDGTNLAPRIECTGAPLRASLTVMTSGTSSNFVDYQLRMDSVAIPSVEKRVQIGGNATSWIMASTLAWQFTPAAGSHIIAPYHIVNTGAAVTFATTTYPLIFAIEEIVRQNANNS